jgi:putative dehydrogenase
MAVNPLSALSHALAARPSRDNQSQARKKFAIARNPGEPPHVRFSKTTHRRHRARLDGFWHGDVSADLIARFVADGGKGAKTPAEAAKGADVVICVVLNAAQTETVLFGKDGVVETLPKDTVFVSSATMDPEVARRLAKQLEATGRHYLDAPISGGAQRAAQGELTILASGSQAAFAKARPALDAMAAKLYELGDAAGQGAAFKMINQLLAGVHIAAASEAITFAAKQGLDLQKVYEVITASAGNSWMFENRMPHVIAGDYKPRSAVEIFVKDLGIVQDMARNARFPAPLASAALQMFLMASASGMGRDDDASVARLYARIGGAELPGKVK